ncbi:aminotransferase class I/II-fold pyridoxal phosphate-dependent enzyme [Vibrio parahaemolyticus]|uniref:aminotransferase class I/II-fold pyridoxal phosphate-dependent enzyme n=1 Tax=Vibrio parahaemolyticus TaxID=670 RepID=UPI00221E451A|nr:aminotransferase class I/II-fold pyridoxal phosphate-dependent enzyme [Vibrio parahaemolyticus]EJG1722873.1 aminotransferase class I/II-fold pyridoxal phosphate-dependent enzyme [Vibrio parahaemolyticus]EJG1736519.1 aminotransferase class I/II-fold pyridoxal phosphate-dependent enzyme [Vibrio parahaemolyticus]EJG1750361.1 aminotransferase class I/II-fold pyridoxal phosphate-dependent enzyme [Vibrio parahaemolyticus]EJG1754529.1 aminotransferase class I/II-fold pyridoxal phosphate-dependent e
MAGCVTQYDNVIICRTLSKAFGLASIRFGYSICHPSLNDVLALVRNTTMFAQVSAIAALRYEQYMMEYVREVEVVRKKTIELLTSTMGSYLKIFNGKGNFLLIEFADIEVKNKLVMVLNRNKVYVRSFDQSSPFHHCIRLSLMSLESFKHFQAVLEEELALVK